MLARGKCMPVNMIPTLSMHCDTFTCICGYGSQCDTFGVSPSEGLPVAMEACIVSIKVNIATKCG